MHDKILSNLTQTQTILDSIDINEQFVNEDFSIKDFENDIDTFFSIKIPYIFKKILGDNPAYKKLVINISKKSYWYFELWKSKNPDKLSEDIIWKNDRFFNKLVDFSDYQNYIIIIADDTMNTGVSLFEFYQFMKKNCSDCIIIPVVCYLNKEYEYSEEENDAYENFRNAVKFYKKVPPSVIGEMCIYETNLFHTELVPYIVDLPIINTLESGKKSYKIKLTKQEFEYLTMENSLWSYTSCDYELLPEKRIFSGFFTMYDPLLETCLSEFSFNNIIKIQYKYDGDSYIAVFTPFAILNSIHAKELENLFFVLFEGSKYAAIFKEYANTHLIKEKNYYTGLYRSVVYYLSMYIGTRFISMLPARYHYYIGDNNQFIREFYSFIEEQFDNNTDTDSFYTKIFWLPSFNKMKTRDAYLEDMDIGLHKKVFTQNKFSYLYEEIISLKRTSSINSFLTNEEIIDLISKSFSFETEDEKKNTITRIIIESLNKSILGNYLSYNNVYGFIYRGYRYGENSELLFPYDGRIFYKGIYEYYQKILRLIDSSSETFSKTLHHIFYKFWNDFIYQFKELLVDNGIIKTVMPEHEFYFFVRYFSNISPNQLKNLIENKKYLLKLTQTDNEYVNVDVIDDAYFYLMYSRIEEFVEHFDITI